MRKTLLALSGIFLMSFLGFNVYLNQLELQDQKQGLKQSFEILNHFTQLQQQRLQRINLHADKEYTPVIDNQKIDFNYGIGGYEFMPVFGYTSENDYVTATYKKIKIVQAYARMTEEKLAITANKARKFKDSIMHTPTIHPIPVDSIYAISSFGLRMHPILHRLKMHNGIDYAVYEGTPVYATADGQVIDVKYDPISGLYVKIYHGYGYTTLYMHLKKALVKRGQLVKKGQEIALTGNTGRSVGPHLHYEVRVNNIPVNPVAFIAHKIEAENQLIATSRKAKSIVIAR